MKKYFVYHELVDSYIHADEANLTHGGDLVFTIDNKFVACFQRDCWGYFKEVESEKAE